ncbi:SusD/RagB family nutrient-binding outer membrane lipoprotein [Flagellimonas olearia]|uniref:SusD/RagB family nutrient-binding outer membrane lipoprotein n=1 Tax=Flagellimonas olearia TaxID=552546 RepID=A0A6I1E1I6_9FLAO|nr:SusD/RagB family nutrient-binding outer membrane lipoprotein [Allomuricauda olearia]KAB7531508.1 SusD/RagB family nutrient-binding outer membrane lipoprotein [Allomuricauda olearia]
MKYLDKLVIVVLIMALGLGGCTNEFNDVNTNPKTLSVDQLDQSSYGYVFRGALFSGVYFGNIMPFLRGHGGFSDMYANYTAHTHPDFFSDRFVMHGEWLNVFWDGFYGSVAPKVKYAEDFAEENGLDIENAMMKVYKVYVYHKITDFWGPIPYSSFGNGEFSVPYDTQEDIYKDFFGELEEAVGILKSHSGEISFLGAQDVVFSGNVDQWLKLANTLRLRLALRVKYVEPELARTQAEIAVADGVIEDNSDNSYVHSAIPFVNNYNRMTPWSDFRMSADMESILKGYEDPRITDYFSPADNPDPSDDPVGMTFDWEGIRNGQSKSDKQSLGLNTNSSNMGPAYMIVGDKGPDWPLLRAAEAYFLRAEGALSGWNMGGSAESLYQEAVTKSLSEYGYDGNNLSGEDFVTSTNIPVGYDSASSAVSSVPVRFDAGGSEERQLEQIITQKWIALFPDSEEAWAERRRTGYPTLYNRLESDNPGISIDEIPSRVPYVGNEYNNNRDAVEEAANSLLGGPDNAVTKLWWDAKD